MHTIELFYWTLNYYSFTLTFSYFTSLILFINLNGATLFGSRGLGKAGLKSPVSVIDGAD